MASLEEWLEGLFAFLGPAGSLLALALLFAIDAAIFPTLPEIAIVVTYLYGAPEWGPLPRAFLLLGMALAGEVAGNTLTYLWVRKLLVDRGRMPRIIERAMARWTQFLLVPDERIILVNRVAPVVPFVGAFIAVLRWSYLKSLAYILIGAAAKYSFLLVVVGALRVAYSRETATLLTLSAVLVLLAVSLVASYFYRRRAPVPPRQAA
jgi:membrane protein YqaA with SNARE-associated domain